MGNYSQLYIGRLCWSWKNYIPAFLTFLFEPEDFFVVRDPDEAEYPEAIGFKTTCKRAVAALERNGFTLDLCAQVYAFFERDLHRSYEEAVREQIIEEAKAELSDERESRVEAHVATFPSISRGQELQEFIEFLRVLLSSDFNPPPFNEPAILKLEGGREYKIPPSEYLLASRAKGTKLQFIDFENLQMYVLDKSLRFPPWIVKLCELFGPDYMSEYPEVISLVFLRLSFEAVDLRGSVKLDLADIFETEGGPAEQEQAIREMHSDLVYSLVEKVNLYNSVFKTLFETEDRVRTSFIKSQCRELLRKCEQAASAAGKGRALEALVEILFTTNHAFELVDKRVSTGDEEIDLVVKNNIDRPFWNAFHSPLFFIECKNWCGRVGAKEVRDFEAKLRNHVALARVGFFVAVNGFTAEACSELKRAGRDSYHVVLLSGDDIRAFVQSPVDFFAWLERQAAVIH